MWASAETNWFCFLFFVFFGTGKRKRRAMTRFLASVIRFAFQVISDSHIFAHIPHTICSVLIRRLRVVFVLRNFQTSYVG